MPHSNTPLERSLCLVLPFWVSIGGALEFVSSIAEIVSGIILVFFPSKYPKFTYFLYACITVFTLLIIISMHFIPYFAQVSMTIGMIGLGFSCSVFMLPFILISKYYHPEMEAYSLNIWLVGVRGSWRIFSLLPTFLSPMQISTGLSLLLSGQPSSFYLLLFCRWV
jgi:hypothetical protein